MKKKIDATMQETRFVKYNSIALVVR